MAVAIGTVLAAIGRIIDDVIEGLSLIFHLDKVLATANMIKQAFGTMTANLVALIGSATPTIDNLFATAEAKIDSAFSSIISSLEGAAAAQDQGPAAISSIGGLNGMGATPNTIFAVGPKGTTQTSSQAVPAMWGVHKLRQKYPGGTLPPGNPNAANVALFSGCVWQSAAAYDGVLVRELPEMHDRIGGYRPAAANSVTLTVWVSEVVTTQAGIEFRGDALRFDREGRPALAYEVSSGETTTATVYFARREGTAWQIQEVSSEAESRPTLAFDAQNRPHITYQQSGVIYHAQHDGNVWSLDAVVTGKGAAAATAIAASDAGTIGLAFSVPTEDPPALYYARLAGSDWIVETVITGTQEGYWHTDWFVGELDFDYDSQGRPHIGFVKTARGLPRDIGSLIHVANIAGVWRSAYVATDMYITGHAMSMADGLGGKVAYSSFGPPCVIPCPRTDTMGIVAIDADGSPGFPTYERIGSALEALAVQGGIPEILYRYYSSGGRELWHDRIGAETIESTLIASDDFGSPALALNGQGEPLVMYYVPSSHQLVTVQPVQVAFPHGLHLPFIGRAQVGSRAR